MEQKISQFNFFTSKDKSQTFKIIYLKKDPDQSLISSFQSMNYNVYTTISTTTAINLLLEESPQVIISGLGSDSSDKYYDLLNISLQTMKKSLFFIIYSYTAHDNPFMRESLVKEGVNMVTNSKKSLIEVLLRIKSTFQPGALKCAFCPYKLSEDSLWHHLPLYHINEYNIDSDCPICKKQSKPNIQVHYRNNHGLCARGEVEREITEDISLYAYALVVVHRKRDNKFLAVQEFASSGFYLPAGRIDKGEDFKNAALREVKEETGLNVVLKGILTLQFKQKDYAKLRIIFYAEMENENDECKSIPDYESAGACFCSFEEIEKIKKRGDDILIWTDYVLKNKTIFGLDLLTYEV